MSEPPTNKATTHFFLWGVFGVFAGGFLKKRVVERGFLVVNLWWNRGELW
jgi:hypothetical protein